MHMAFKSVPEHPTGQVRFFRASLYKATQEEAVEARGSVQPPLGGDPSDLGSANCARMASRRLHSLADLASRQVRCHDLRWANDMRRHRRCLEQGGLGRVRSATAARQLVWLRRLEAAELQQSAMELRGQE